MVTNEVLNTILSRKGVKQYKSNPVPRENNFAKQDCSAANENMALAAKSLGLASRYLDVPNLYTNTPEGAGCKEMCGIPKDYDTVCFLCLGYSDDISEQPTPKRGDVVNYVD